MKKLKAQSAKPTRSFKSQGPITQRRTSIGVWSLGFLLSFELGFLSFALLLSVPSTVHSQPAPPNRVLDLDGTGDWVELPPAGFTNLHQATIEVWVKWRAFNTLARVFDFGVL